MTEEVKKERLFGNWRQPHTKAYLWDSVTVGVVFTTNFYLNIAILRTAGVAAGCGGASDETCNKSVYGLKPSSWVTAVATAGSLLGAVLAPLLGAYTDYSANRKLIGAGSAWLLGIITLLQASISQRTWVFVAILQVPALTTYVVHQGTILSYLPGLSRIEGSAVDDVSVRYRVNSCSIALIFGTMIGSLAIVGAVAFGLGLGVVNASALAQLLAGIILCTVYTFIWFPGTHLYSGAFIDIPPLKVAPQSYGFFKIVRHETVGAYRLIRDHYSDVGSFLVGYALTNAAMSSFASLAVVYLDESLHFPPAMILGVILIFILSAAPAGAIAAPLMRKYGARDTFLCCVIVMGAFTGGAGIVLWDPMLRLLVFPLSFVWGVCFGIFYSSNTSFFTALVPKHSESFFMSYYYSAAIILTWAPTAIFTILNQLTNATQLVFFILTLFFAAGYPFVRRVDIQRARFQATRQDSKIALGAVAPGVELPPATDDPEAAARVKESTDDDPTTR